MGPAWAAGGGWAGPAVGDPLRAGCPVQGEALRRGVAAQREWHAESLPADGCDARGWELAELGGMGGRRGLGGLRCSALQVWTRMD